MILVFCLIDKEASTVLLVYLFCCKTHMERSSTK